MRILVVEDEKLLCDGIAEDLELEKYTVERCYDGAEAYDLLLSESFDLLILDLNLPGMDGLEILRRLREGRDTADVPVIMLTARSAEMDRVAGLENGADDYVVKPFGIMELQARVKAVLRRTERRGDRVLTWGDVELDPAAREVHKAGKPVELTYKEYSLLRLLLEHTNLVVTRETILQVVWGTDISVESRTVDMHIRTLRKKLGDAGKYICTVRKVGYKLADSEEEPEE